MKITVVINKSKVLYNKMKYFSKTKNFIKLLKAIPLNCFSHKATNKYFFKSLYKFNQSSASLSLNF